MGYFAYEKYLEEFSYLVTCDRCRWCEGKVNSNRLCSYYCSAPGAGKDYIDPKARKICNYYEEIDSEGRGDRINRMFNEVNKD